jgi:hypothetical protein
MNTFLNVMEVLVWGACGMCGLTCALAIYIKVWDPDGEREVEDRRIGPADRRRAVPRLG